MEEIINWKNRVEEVEAEKKKLELRLEELNDFIENASISLHWVNGSGIIIWANRVELELLGYEKEEYLNQHITKFHADQPAIEDILTRLVHKETLVNYPARLRCKNGDIKHVLINSNVLWKDGKFIHTRCFTRDITNIKNKDDEKNKLIDTLREEIHALNEENKILKKHSKA
jgi:two-component system sensor histidine kinase VicK